MAFTPKPWRVTSQAGYTGHGVNAGSFRVCSINSNSALPHDERDANAHLIATAPELFEQVLLLEKTIEYQIRVANAKGDDEGARLQSFTLHLVREVIAKAKGGGAEAPFKSRRAR